jgi:hypothetical protein
MGRHYSGDINGKFWFAVQPSDAAERFGADPQEPSTINYYLNLDDLETVQEELESIENEVDIRKLINFFETRNGYSDEDLDKAGISDGEVRDYADYVLGKKIEKCLIENGECSFEAEL